MSLLHQQNIGMTDWTGREINKLLIGCSWYLDFEKWFAPNYIAKYTY